MELKGQQSSVFLPRDPGIELSSSDLPTGAFTELSGQPALLFPLVESGFSLHMRSYFKLIPSEKISCQLAHPHLHGL